MDTNFIQMQEKLRNNNEDLESFMRELDSWQEEMSAKDSQLSKKAILEEGNKRDYVEKDSQSQVCDKENRLNDFPMIQRAIVEKDKGNEFFKRGEYQKAIDCYTQGLKCDPRSAVLAANRGMALLKLNREKEAEQDCTLAITLDPTYAKAYIRRAYARSGLKRYSDAITDYEKVLEIEPKNKMAKTEMEKLMRRKETTTCEKKSPGSSKSSFEQNMKNVFLKTKTKEDVNKKEKSHLTREESSSLKVLSTKKLDSNIVYPCDKPPHKRSKKPLKRIQIVDVNETCNEAPIADVIEKDLSKSLEEVVQVSKPKHTPKIFVKPKNAVQFDCTWRSLENDKERGQYLSLIPPKEFSSLFKHSLESDVFSSIIRVLKKEFITHEELIKDVPDVLIGLSRVERLSVLLMFLEKEEKESLNAILDSVKNYCDPGKMKQLLKYFG